MERTCRPETVGRFHLLLDRYLVSDSDHRIGLVGMDVEARIAQSIPHSSKRAQLKRCLMSFASMGRAIEIFACYLNDFKFYCRAIPAWLIGGLLVSIYVGIVMRSGSWLFDACLVRLHFLFHSQRARLDKSAIVAVLPMTIPAMAPLVRWLGVMLGTLVFVVPLFWPALKSCAK